MFSRPVFLTCILLLGAVASAHAMPPEGAQPDFGRALYADEELWGTQGAAALPPPSDENDQSFDALYVVLNGVEGQVPVGEAAPGNPDYDGGRWDTHKVMWISAPELLTSFADGPSAGGCATNVDIHEWAV